MKRIPYFWVAKSVLFLLNSFSLFLKWRNQGTGRYLLFPQMSCVGGDCFWSRWHDNVQRVLTKDAKMLKQKWVRYSVHTHTRKAPLNIKYFPLKPQISSVNLFDVFGILRILAGLCFPSVCFTIRTKKTLRSRCLRRLVKINTGHWCLRRISWLGR